MKSPVAQADAPQSEGQDQAGSNIDALPVKPALSVIGLGYLGTVSMACLANLGFQMNGADIIDTRAKTIARGKTDFSEEGLADLLSDGVERGLISASTDVRKAVLSSDITFICVGTPATKSGRCDLQYVRSAARAIGQALSEKETYHVIAVRSRVPPGTTMNVIVPEIEETSGRTFGVHFGICYNPEFMREGVAVSDFYAPSKTVIGASDMRAGAVLSSVYRLVDEKLLICSITASEMVKYIDTVWHATKITFSNEVGRLCKAVEIDSHEVMNMFVQDTKLNLSAAYLKPGFAFGGSCLPREVRAIEYLSDNYQVPTPLFHALAVSNQMQIDECLRLIRKFPGKRIGFLGIAFKCDTDDLRESPALDLMAGALQDGTEFQAYDPNFTLNDNTRDHMENIKQVRPEFTLLMDRFPQILNSNLNDVVAQADVLVVSQDHSRFRDAVLNRPQGVKIVDLVRLFPEAPNDPDYYGISW